MPQIFTQWKLFLRETLLFYAELFMRLTPGPPQPGDWGPGHHPDQQGNAGQQDQSGNIHRPQGQLENGGPLGHLNSGNFGGPPFSESPQYGQEK